MFKGSDVHCNCPRLNPRSKIRAARRPSIQTSPRSAHKRKHKLCYRNQPIRLPLSWNKCLKKKNQNRNECVTAMFRIGTATQPTQARTAKHERGQSRLRFRLCSRLRRSRGVRLRQRAQANHSKNVSVCETTETVCQTRSTFPPILDLFL
jgi:hypothetical protein